MLEPECLSPKTGVVLAAGKQWPWRGGKCSCCQSGSVPLFHSPSNPVSRIPVPFTWGSWVHTQKGGTWPIGPALPALSPRSWDGRSQAREGRWYVLFLGLPAEAHRGHHPPLSSLPWGSSVSVSLLLSPSQHGLTPFLHCNGSQKDTSVPRNSPM